MILNIRKEKKKLSFKKFIKTLGPGLITGAADDDPSGIATYSQTGAQYGYNLLWTALFMLPMMYVIQEMAARIGVVTGKGLASNIKIHYSKTLLYILVILLLIANIINLGTDLGAMAAAAQLLVPVDFKLLTVLFTLLILSLEVFTSYKRYSSILKWLTLSLFAYIITGFFINNDWGKVLSYSVIPHLQLNFQFLFIIVGVLGTTISPYMMFWQANEEVEEEINKRILPKKGGVPKIGLKYLGKMRLDTLIGMVFSEVTTWFILSTTAGTLNKHGIINIQTASQAAQALEPLVHSFPFAGELAKSLFALGIIGTGLLAVPIFAASASYAVCEVAGWKEGLYNKPNKARSFYIIILISTLIGLLINFIGINPIQALVYTAVINGIISVPLIGMIIFITNNKKIMGEHTNNRYTNIISFITFSVMALAALGTISTFIFMH